jgi:hypothetical protein
MRPEQFGELSGELSGADETEGERHGWPFQEVVRCRRRNQKSLSEKENTVPSATRIV